MRELYNNLLKEIVELTGNRDITIVKMHFHNAVNSKRALSRIQTIEELLKLLEQRDLLHSKDVSVLHHIAELLNNSNIKEALQAYEKLSNINSKCRVCGSEVSFQPTPLQPSNSLQQQNGDPNQYFTRELYEAIENVARCIGWRWRALASELQVREFQVDWIRGQYPNDMAEQARQMLHIWMRNNENSVTVEMLRKALDKRLCKRKGIGSHMMKPLVGITC